MCQQGLLCPTEISISWQCQKFPYLQMLPAAKKKNKKHTWETSRTQRVCETIEKLSLRGGIPSIKDSHRTGEDAAGTGVTGTRSLRKEEIASSRRKSCRAPRTDVPEQQPGISAHPQSSSTQPSLLLGAQLLRQPQNLPPKLQQEKPKAATSAEQGWSGWFCQKGVGHILTAPQLGVGKGFASLHFCVLLLLLGMRELLCLVQILSYQNLCRACLWQYWEQPSVWLCRWTNSAQNLAFVIFHTTYAANTLPKDRLVLTDSYDPLETLIPEPLFFSFLLGKAHHQLA